MSEALIGSNQFYGVPFPIAIGDRYIHVAQRPDGSMTVQAFRWDPDTRTVEEETLEQTDPDAPLTILPVAGHGGVRLIARAAAVEGYVTNDSEAVAYTILLQRDRIIIMRGDTTVAEFQDNTIVGVEVGIRIDADGVSLGGSLPEGFEYRQVHRDETVTLSTLVTVERPVLERRRFVRCRVHGPAILAAIGPLTVAGTSFDLGGMPLESLVWELRPGQSPCGAILVRDVEFEGSDFVGVAFAVEAGSADRFLAGFRR